MSKEYLRRNLIHASAVGSASAFSAALDRLSQTKRPQKWLVQMLRGGLERAERVHPEVARWRNGAPDAPAYVKRV
jgi:hypothetical protein